VSIQWIMKHAAQMKFLPVAALVAFLAGCAAVSSVHEAKGLCLDGQPHLSVWGRTRVPDPCGILAGRRLEGMGTVVAVQRVQGRLIVDHEEIPQQMRAMVMSYAVTPATLLDALTPGEVVRFTIDAGEQAIVDIGPIAQ
jgi:Cu/Ag efflux protein CusF